MKNGTGTCETCGKPVNETWASCYFCLEPINNFEVQVVSSNGKKGKKVPFKVNIVR